METTRDLSVSRYIAQVGRFPKLSREREAELCQLWRDQRDQRARDELVQANLRYVVALATKYRRYGLPIGELVAEGSLGLLHAVDKFEPERGLRFVTYAAYWIRAHILSTVCRSWSMVNSGSGPLRTKMFFKLRREKARIVNLVGEGEAALDVLAERFDVSRSQMAEMVRRLESRDLSLDCPLVAAGITTHIENLVSPGCNQEQVYANEESERQTHHVVHYALGALDSRERFIIEQRLMKDDEDRLSLAEMGRRLGVSRERVRQLEIRAIQRLRSRITEHVDPAGPEGSFLGSAA